MLDYLFGRGVVLEELDLSRNEFTVTYGLAFHGFKLNDYLDLD